MDLVATIAARKERQLKFSKQMLSVAVLTASVVGVGAFALSASAQSTNGDESLASKIASKFNLNREEVQTVLNEHRTEQRAEHRAEHLQKLEERLTTAVSNGKLSEEQKTKILDYVKSQQSFMDSLADKTPEERREAMKTHREEMKKWAQDNGIDPSYVLFGGGMRGGHGHMGMKGE